MAVGPYDSPMRRAARRWIWSFAPQRAAEPARPDESARDEFFRNVAEASALLNFLLRERERIPDDIIDRIKSASKPKDPSEPSQEEHAKLLEAYRDLIAVPRCAIAYDGIPPTTFWHPGSLWPVALLLACVIPSIILALTLKAYWYWSIIFTLVSALTIWGLYAFTGVPTDTKINQMIRVCYLYTGIFIMGSTFPFLSPYLFHISLSGEAPLGILRGCAQPIDDNLPPKDVRCAEPGKPDAYQWIMRFGGVVDTWPTSTLPGTGQVPPHVEASPAVPKEAAGPAAVQKQADPLPAAKQPASNETGTGQGAAPSETRSAAPVKGAEAPVAAAKQTEPPLAAKQSAGGATESKSIVRGGLVVPLYVIVLALIGGAVSMTRRVPEYQRRAMDQQDALTNVQAREMLVFQLMQVISAPLIAVTAYYIVSPNNAAASVVLGFGSGFASEPILLMIRGLVEKISPAKEFQPTAVTVSVTPPSATLAPKEAKQFKATVLGSTNAQVTWAIEPPDGSVGTVSQSGYYMAPDLSAGKSATIIARSVADPTKSGSVSIKIEPAAKVEPGVRVTPPTVTVRVGQEQQFGAEVSGLSDRNVTWGLEPAEAASGTISSNGKYTAPAAITAAPVKVIARSAADSTKFGSATVTLQP